MVKLRIIGVLLSGALFGGACGTSDGTKPVDPPGARAASGFESDAEGWTIIGDAQASTAKPDYNGTGGNPDGLISAVDNVTGGVWFFVAPAKYLGDASATYGRYLKYDLKTTNVSNLLDDFQVVLQGGGIMLGYYSTTPRDPGTNTWTSYKIQLSETGGWVKIPDYARASFDAHFDTRTLTLTNLTVPTNAEFQSVLSDLTLFLIRGEFNTGADTGSLDNVRFGATQ